MTTAGKKITMVTKPYETGKITDRNTVKRAFGFLGLLLVFTFISVLACSMFLFDNQALRIILYDSANKRISIAEAFLAVDGILELCLNVTNGLVVNEKVIEKRLLSELPFMATENIMMNAVKAGENRQDMHEKIRTLSMQAGARVKKEGLDNNLLDLVAEDPSFHVTREELDGIMNTADYVGRSVYQVEKYVADVVDPVINERSDCLGLSGHVSV